MTNIIKLDESREHENFMKIKITIEGPAGAGKTRLAHEIANLWSGIHVILLEEGGNIAAEWGNRKWKRKIEIITVQTPTE